MLLNPELKSVMSGFFFCIMQKRPDFVAKMTYDELTPCFRLFN